MSVDVPTKLGSSYRGQVLSSGSKIIKLHLEMQIGKGELTAR